MRKAREKLWMYNKQTQSGYVQRPQSSVKLEQGNYYTHSFIDFHVIFGTYNIAH